MLSFIGLKDENGDAELLAAMDYLFAYGTLKSGLAPAEIAGVTTKLKSLGPGIVRGTLYNLGSYPGLRLDGTDEISGEVFVFQEHSIFESLDAYEGYDPSRPERSLFVRKRCQVRLEEQDEVLLCWVYEYNRQPALSRQIDTWIPLKKP